MNPLRIVVLCTLVVAGSCFSCQLVGDDFTILGTGSTGVAFQNSFSQCTGCNDAVSCLTGKNIIIRRFNHPDDVVQIDAPDINVMSIDIGANGGIMEDASFAGPREPFQSISVTVGHVDDNRNINNDGGVQAAVYVWNNRGLYAGGNDPVENQIDFECALDQSTDCEQVEGNGFFALKNGVMSVADRGSITVKTGSISSSTSSAIEIKNTGVNVTIEASGLVKAGLTGYASTPQRLSNGIVPSVLNVHHHRAGTILFKSTYIGLDTLTADTGAPEGTVPLQYVGSPDLSCGNVDFAAPLVKDNYCNDDTEREFIVSTRGRIDPITTPSIVGYFSKTGRTRYRIEGPCGPPSDLKHFPFQFSNVASWDNVEVVSDQVDQSSFAFGVQDLGCVASASCDTFDSNLCTAANQVPVTNPDTVECPSGGCDVATCCQPVPCSSYTCSAGLIPKTGATDQCVDGVCDDQQCCVECNTDTDCPGRECLSSGFCDCSPCSLGNGPDSCDDGNFCTNDTCAEFPINGTGAPQSCCSRLPIPDLVDKSLAMLAASGNTLTDECYNQEFEPGPFCLFCGNNRWTHKRKVSVCASTTFQDSTEQHDLCRTAKSLKVSQFYSRRWRRRGLDINIGPCGCGFTGLPTFDELETFTAASAVTAGQSQVESTGVPVAVVAGGAAVMVTIIVGMSVYMIKLKRRSRLLNSLAETYHSSVSLSARSEAGSSSNLMSTTRA